MQVERLTDNIYFTSYGNTKGKVIALEDVSESEKEILKVLKVLIFGK